MLSPRFTVLIGELQVISPMPDDETLLKLSQENHPLDKLYHILGVLEREIKEQYPIEIIPSLLDVFGVGEGMEVFQYIMTLIEKYPNPEEMYPLIQQGTSSAHPGTRKWSCLLLGRRRDKRDEPFFTARLQDKFAVVRQYALVGILMLAQRHDMRHLIPVVEPLLQDEDSEVRNTAIDALDMLRRSEQEHEE